MNMQNATKGLVSHTEHLSITTKHRYEILDITGHVEEVRKKARLADGFILVSTMHITASIFVNDHESGLWQDIMAWLEELAPRRPDYKHHLTGEDNADAHLKRMLLGHQVIVPVTGSRLDLGTWERVHYGEFDGRRPKRILFKALGIAEGTQPRIAAAFTPSETWASYFSKFLAKRPATFFA